MTERCIRWFYGFSNADQDDVNTKQLKAETYQRHSAIFKVHATLLEAL